MQGGQACEGRRGGGRCWRPAWGGAGPAHCCFGSGVHVARRRSWRGADRLSVPDGAQRVMAGAAPRRDVEGQFVPVWIVEADETASGAVDDLGVLDAEPVEVGGAG